MNWNTLGLGVGKSRPLSGASVPLNPTHANLPVLGWKQVKSVWWDNDEYNDQYSEEFIAAAHIGGYINLVGWSQTASTNATEAGYTNGYNPTLSDSYMTTENTARIAAITKYANSGWKTSLLPSNGTLFKGHFVNSSTRVNHPSTAALVSAVNANYESGQPFIFLAGGQLTLLADAYLSIVDLTERAAWAAKIVVVFVGGDIGVNYGAYNEWADNLAANLVYENFTIVHCPTIAGTFPAVPKTELGTASTARLPRSEIQAAMFAKDRIGNDLPGDIDGDASPLCCLLNPSYATTVTRYTFNGTRNMDQGNIGGATVVRPIPLLATSGSGNIYYLTAVSQAQATSTWWSILTRPGLWQNEEISTVSAVKTLDTFNRGNGGLGAGYEQFGSIARNNIISQVLGLASGPAYAYDRATETYGNNQYAQIKYAANGVASKFAGIAIRAAFHSGNDINGYYLYQNGVTDQRVQKGVGAVYTQIITGMPIATSGQNWRLQAKGSVITVWRNNGSETANGVMAGGYKMMGVIVDTALTTGKPAIVNSASGAATFSDEFEAGNLT